MRDKVHAHRDKRQYVYVISTHLRIWTYAADLHQYIEARDTLDLKEEARKTILSFFSLFTLNMTLADRNQILPFPPLLKCLCEKRCICLSTLRRITTSEMNSSNCRYRKKNQKAIRSYLVSFFSSSLLLPLSLVSFSIFLFNCLFERNLSFTHLFFYSNLECHILLAENIEKVKEQRLNVYSSDDIVRFLSFFLFHVDSN